MVDRTKAIGGDDSKDDISANELVAQTNAGKISRSSPLNQMSGI